MTLDLITILTTNVAIQWYNDVYPYFEVQEVTRKKKTKVCKNLSTTPGWEIENLFLFFFKESHHVTPASLELTRWTRLALNLQLSPSLCLQSTENKGMHDHTYLETKFSILISQF